jgi:hypothetical protein
MPAPSLTIDCDQCVMQHSGACDDCVVSFLLEREPDDAVVIDADEVRAIRMLEQAGLLPSLRFEDREGRPGAAWAQPAKDLEDQAV